MMNTIDTVSLDPTPATTRLDVGAPPPRAQRPPRGLFSLVFSVWPWRALIYLGSGILVGLAWFTVFVAWLTVGAAAFIVGGFMLFVLFPALGSGLGALERRRLALMGYPPVPTPHRVPERPGLWQWVKTRWSEAATWREMAQGGFLTVMAYVDFAVLTAWATIVATLIGLPYLRYLVDRNLLDGTAGLTVPGYTVNLGSIPWATVWIGSAIGVVLLLLSAWPLTAYARGRATFANWLLAPPTADAAEVIESRSRIVTTFDSERRRIERDLHDGPQQQLTALLITLGMARAEAGEEPVQGLIADAQSQAKTALDDLRNVVQGIHPSLLTDRGLAAAVEAMARRMPIDVAVTADLHRALSEQTEVAAYFTVSEALTNVVKHSGSPSAEVNLRTVGDRLVVTVCDQGCGGADALRGTGLVGMRDRVQAVGGSLTLSSPVGGPTQVQAELPCG